MAQNPLIKRYLDAGMAFTQMTQARAEAIVSELVKAGEVQAQKTEELVTQLVERSRQNTERFLEQVRTEVRSQIAALGLATQDDIARLESRLDAASGTKAPAKKPAKKRTAAKKPATKKAAPKKASPKKAVAKKRATKTRAAKKSAS